MSNFIRFILYVFITSVLIAYFFVGNIGAFDKDTGADKGYKIILVVDVSPSLKYNKKTVKGIVSFVFDSIFKSQRDEIHLITFSEHADIIFADPNKESFLSAIEGEMKKKNWHTMPIYGLSKVFYFIGDKFSSKVGIVLFISDGEDSRGNAQIYNHEVQPLILSLKNNGLNLFSIFVSTNTRFSNREFMASIAKWSGNPLYEITSDNDISLVLNGLEKEISQTIYSGPISHEEFIKAKKQWHKNLQKEIDKVQNKLNANFQEELYNAQKKWKTDLKNQLDQVNKQLSSNLQQKNKTLESNKNSGMLITWHHLLSLFVILIFITTFVLVRILKTPKIQNNSTFLWGKLILPYEVHKENIIDLSDKSGGYNVKTYKKYPDFKLLHDYRNNKKVIVIQPADSFSIKYLDIKKQINPNQYLGEYNCFFRVEHSNSFERYDEYEYRFLDSLAKSLSQPYYDKKLFCDFNRLIDKIKTNFLKESNIKNYIISGMGNSGKTSILKYFYNITFYDSMRLTQSYKIDLLEFKSLKDFDINEIKALFVYDKRRSILLIDEYDNFINKFSNDFIEWIYDLYTNHNVYFIFAGREDQKKMKNKALDFISNSYHIVLNGNNSSKNIEFLDALLLDIGFNIKMLSHNVKRKIVEYSSGFPYFIKKIVLQLITDWIHSNNYNTLTVKDLENTVSKLVEPEKLYTLIKVCNDDDVEQNIINNSSHKVFFRDIFNLLSTLGKGRLNKELLKKELLDDIDENIKPEITKKIEEKLEKLISLGFIIEIELDIIGVPYLFYYKGEKVV